MLQDLASPPCMFLGTSVQWAVSKLTRGSMGTRGRTAHTQIHFAPRLWSQGLQQEPWERRAGPAPWRPELLGRWLLPEGEHAPTHLGSNFSER